MNDYDLSNHSLRINPLANSKGTRSYFYNSSNSGVKLQCELCGKPAYLQCKLCRVTYYCEKEHEALDFRGIHQKICQLLIPVRTPLAVLGTESERLRRNEQIREHQNNLFIVTETEAQKLLFEEQYDLAVPAALQALRASVIVSGPNSIDLVPSFLLLGKASIGLKQFQKAEEYLSLAKWAILKAPDCKLGFRGLLHRNIGLLYLSQGNYPEALQNLSLDVYYHSIENNPEHITVSGGYYQIGIVFHKQNKIDLVNSFYDKVVTIWKTTLKADQERFNPAQKAEAVHMLTTIYGFRLNYSKGLIAVAEVDYILGMLFNSTKEYEKALEHASKSLTAFESALGREHSLTIEVKKLCKTLMDDYHAPTKKRGSSILQK